MEFYIKPGEERNHAERGENKANRGGNASADTAQVTADKSGSVEGERPEELAEGRMAEVEQQLEDK